MITSLLLLTSAFAGAPRGFIPGVEGQWGLGAPVASEDGARVALTTWNNQGLWVLDLDTGAVQRVSGALGAGFHPEWSGDDLLFKAVVGGESATQRVSRLRAGAVEVLDTGAQQGQPAALGESAVLWADGDVLRVHGPSGERVLPGVGDVHLVEPDPAGGRIAYDDGDGRLVVRDLETGRAVVLTDAGRGSHPQWSPDGELLLHRGMDGRFVVVDPETGASLGATTGTNPQWMPDGQSVVFERLSTGTPDDSDSPYVVTGSALYTLDVYTGEVRRLLATPRLHPRYPTPLGTTGDVLFVDTVSGSLYRLSGGVAHLVLSAREIEEDVPADAPPPPDYPSTTVWVPYMHQLWDTPDDFDGGWSCGPTSNLQVLGTWGVLPEATITCSWPYAHSSAWGTYVPNSYSFNGYTYDTWGEASSAWVQGAHGFICREYGGAVWAYMTAFMAQHGVDSAQVGTDYSTLIGQIDAGYPMYASTSVLGYGHILAPRGYMTNDGSPIHSIIVNDPYGNAGSGDWGNYDGDGIAYDWPGYNNGHLEISISQLFTAHGSAPVTEDTSSTTPQDTGGSSTPQDTGGSATPTDTAASADDGSTTPTTSTPTADDETTAWAPAPGELTAKDELGGCSTAPGGGWMAGALALLGLARRRRTIN